jgi:hypothetical protein
MHVTRGEVFSWITEWVEDFGVEWREVPQTIFDKKAGLTSDLKALLKQDRDLRLVILEKPVPKSLTVDLDFFTTLPLIERGLMWGVNHANDWTKLSSQGSFRWLST